MKLKYRRLIILMTMSIMGIGFITLSITSPTQLPNVNDTKNGDTVNKNLGGKLITDTPDNPSTEPAGNADKNAKLQTTEEALGKDLEKEMNELIKNYCDASVRGDFNVLSKLVSDVKKLDKKRLQEQYEYVEGYRNIQCFIMDGPKKGTYCVYVYSDLKILNVDTLAPGLIGLYITTSSGGKLQVYSGELDDQTKNYILNMNKSNDVKKLSNKVNKMLQEAITKDPELEAFYNKIAGSAKKQ